MLRVWTFKHVLVLAALIVLVLAELAALGHWLHNWQAWFTVGVGLFIAAFLPWRAEP